MRMRKTHVISALDSGMRAPSHAQRSYYRKNVIVRRHWNEGSLNKDIEDGVSETAGPRTIDVLPRPNMHNKFGM